MVKWAGISKLKQIGGTHCTVDLCYIFFALMVRFHMARSNNGM